MAGGGGHRSTLKQKNKSHNHGKHRSKRNMKREAHGKVGVKQQSRENKLKEVLRREASQSHSDGRRQELEGRRGLTTPPPPLVVVVSLDKSVDSTAVVELLKEADLSSQTHLSAQCVCHVSACKLKKRMCFLVPDCRDLQSLLDAAKVADVLLFLVGEEGIDQYGDHCLTCILGQGVPSHVFASQGLKNLSKKKLSDAKKRIEKQIDKRFPGEKFRSIDTWQDADILFRQMTNLTRKTVHFRDSRPYLLAESLAFEASGEGDEDTTEQGEVLGTLKVSGYLRGQRLNVNQLVHMPGWGDFQMAQIDQTDDPYPLVVKGNKDRWHKKGEATEVEMKEVNSTFCLAKATNPESLQSEVVPDAMDQEQTWPTPEELGEVKSSKVKSLKGVSDYQRNWILDLDDTEENLDESDGDDEMMEEGMTGQLEKEYDADGDHDEEIGDDEDDDLDAVTSGGDNITSYDEQIDMDEDRRMYERLKEEKLHVHFPDEIDTPIDIPARTRFARYRGMDSFQTNVWDPNDSLPFDYARIYRVSRHHYKRLRKLSMKEREEEDETDNLLAEPGNFITVYVKNVPKSFMDSHKASVPVTLYGLFSNEQKMTLVSTLISRAPGFKAPVKAKDPLTFQIGFRRFSACPIFSEHSYQNKFKMERYLPQSGFIVASMFAPIMFAPAPVLVFRENVMGQDDLVAKGSLLPLDTDRIVVKRVVLSGAPFKINKKSVVVRYMFFNREDIDFYKPVELRTKWGKRGHIRQALGTHGHMKCTFNGQLKSEDTVLMNLYKRVFPKWSYNPHVTILPPNIEQQETDSQMVEETEEPTGEAYAMFD